jgi:sialic acid synthase SpsE
MKTFIIAEAGANHNRDWDTATRLIDAAIESQADAIKFQTYSSETLYRKNTSDFAGYRNINQLIKDIELPRHWQKDLKLYCDDNGIEFMSTPFDERAVDELHALGVKRLKIAGFESTDPRFVSYVASTGLPLIISLGIGSTTECAHDINVSILRQKDIDLEKHSAVDDFGLPDDFKMALHIWYKDNMPNVTYLHCNNAYPTPFKDINLSTLLKLKNLIEWNKSFCNSSCGLSDHSDGILIPPIAVALGATTIEKHFTLDKRMPGPDHAFAIEPLELKNMVKNIRLAEKSLGEKQCAFTKSELNFKNACRSVIAKHSINKGDILNEDNLTTKRPCQEGDLPAKYFYQLVGERATKDLQLDQPLQLNDYVNNL